MMVDAAYYRRQAATCRQVAGRFRRPERLLDLAAYFDRKAAQSEDASEANAVPPRPAGGASRTRPPGSVERAPAAPARPRRG